MSEAIKPYTASSAHVYIAKYICGDGWWLDEQGNNWWNRKAHFRFHAVYLTKVGAFDLKIGDTWYHITPHRFVYIPAGSDLEFRFDGSGPLEKYFTHFDLSFGTKTLSEAFRIPAVLVPRDEAHAEALFSSLLRCAENGTDPASEIAVSGALLSLVAELLSSDGVAPVTAQPPIEKEMRETVAYIERHFGDALSVSALAARVGYSETYFSKKFKKTFGCTPSDYIAELRLRYAKLWLEEGTASVAEIAAALGFTDAGYFSNFFKAKTGLSPICYRKSGR